MSHITNRLKPLGLLWLCIVVAGLLGIFLLSQSELSRLWPDQVRVSGYNNTAFSFSRQGDRMVFTDRGEGRCDLYILNLKSQNAVRVAKTPEYEGSPSFSYDGKWITYSAAIPNDDADHIFVRAADGSSVRQITSERQNDSAPCFSPSGSQIVFARNHRVTGGLKAPTWSGHCALYIINTNGTQLRRLSDIYSDIYQGEIVHPQFTPDGSSIIFTMGLNIYSLKVKNGQSFKPRKLNRRGGIEYASLSPDGRQLVTSTYDGYVQLMSSDGASSSRITNPNLAKVGHPERPTFTPDGKHIAFMVRKWDRRSEDRNFLWQMDTSGRNLRRLTKEALVSSPW